jgi:putative proteasome-type protease
VARAPQMTYCVALRLDSGLVYLSDSRTNAGVDQVGTYRKMLVFERPGERVLTLMTAGNLAISQSVRQIIEGRSSDGRSLWTVNSLYDGVLLIGEAVRAVRARDAAALAEAGIEFNISIIFGGQIKGEGTRLFMVYAAGNFIEASSESPYLQIGEAKYGKPVLDRMVRPGLSLDVGAKCALVSMDSTLRSNISVGLPLDLLCYEVDTLRVSRFATIDTRNSYFGMIHETWGERLKQVFQEIPDPVWGSAAAIAPSAGEQRNLEPMRAEMPRELVESEGRVTRSDFQTLAEQERAPSQLL